MNRLTNPGETSKPTVARGASPIIEPMLSIDDLAEILNCSRRAVERLRASGNIPRPDIQVGRMPRWKTATVRAWIQRGGVK